MKPTPEHPIDPDEVVSAQELNHTCYCKTLNKKVLQNQLDCDPSVSGIVADLWQSRPHMFYSTVVFVSPETHQNTPFK